MLIGKWYFIDVLGLFWNKYLNKIDMFGYFEYG